MISVGDRVHFHAMGRYRYGTVIKVGPKRVRIEWVAPSTGLTHFKYVSLDARHLHLLTEHCPEPVPRAKRDWSKCRQCGNEMTPADYAVGPVCLDCAKKNAKEVLGE